MWTWRAFLEQTAKQYGLEPHEEKVLLLLQQNFSKRSSLESLVVSHDAFDISTETFKNWMSCIYDKLKIESNGHSPNRFSRFMKKLKQEFEMANSQSISSNFSPEDVGIIRVYPRFPIEEFKNRLSEVIHKEDTEYKKVEILQTFAPNLNYFQHELIACIRHQVSVRIVLSWPLSVIATFREDVLNQYASSAHHEPINFKHEVEENLETLRNIILVSGVDLTQNLLQIKLYDTIPSLAIYRAGDYMLVSSFFHSQLAINSFQLGINLSANHSLIVDTYQKDFWKMCELSKDFTKALVDENWRNTLETLFIEFP